MPMQEVRVPSLLGGVSRVSQNGRLPHELEAAINVELYPDKGVDKRPGTEYIDAPGTTEGNLNHTGTNAATHVVHTFWINRGTGEQFVGFIDPSFDTEDIIQIYALDGTKQTVVGSNGTDNLGHASNEGLRDYIMAGSGDARQLIRTLTVEDSTFILNRTVSTALTGKRLTYKNGDTPPEVRKKANNQNKRAWSDFDVPPTVDNASLTIPIGLPADANEDVTDDGLWYARDDDVGQPSGFYHAISDTHPPWFRRVRTEPRNSVLDEETFPLRMDYDGTKFIVDFGEWTHRLSGDSTSNPGPTFIGNPISDMTFHQDRLWFVSGERIVSTRLGDILNLWVDSPVLLTDSDPIDVALSGNKFSEIDFVTTFRESLICLTRGSRQVEVRANGPMTPQTIMLFDSTNISSVPYVQPCKLGSQMYFMGERDFANVVWEYHYLADAIANSATEITNRVSGFIPAEASRMIASESHDQLFVLTDAQPNYIYVNKMQWNGQDKQMNSWYYWDFGREVMSADVFGDYLYIVFRDDTKFWLEKISLGKPQQDTDGTPTQTLSYAVRLDRKIKVQGSYNAGTNVTTWTVPFASAALDEIVLAATWDTDDVKMAGSRLSGFTVSEGATSTTITIDGDYENNADGDNAPAYIGISYEASVELSEQFVRTGEGIILHGNTSILSAKVRHRDAAYYFIEITPPGREVLKHEFIVPFIGSTPLDSDQLDTFGEFQFRVMAPTHGTVIRIVNDSPFPAAWIDLDFNVRWNPGRSPIK